MATSFAPFASSVSPTKRAALISAAAGLIAGALVLYLAHDPLLAGGFLATAVVLGGALLAWHALRDREEDVAGSVDWSVARALAAVSEDAVAITDYAGKLVCANDPYEAMFGGYPTPPGVPLDDEMVSRLGAAGRAAWRDGSGEAELMLRDGRRVIAAVTRTGDAQDMLVWRIFRPLDGDPRRGLEIERIVSGASGDRLSAAGIMIALVGPDARVIAANRAFRLRATGRDDDGIAGRDFARFLVNDTQGQVRFEREGLGGTPLRVLQVPFAADETAPMLIAMIDEEERQPLPAIAGNAAAHVKNLIGLLPFGMALVDRDGRFVQMNEPFLRAAEADPAAPPLYPGDLVVREDKAAVADAIRRFAAGAAHAADMAVRLKHNPEEPVALTIAGARGLGDAAVLLSLKDNSEESRLKREVAQATKMQAVGQLAGGVAHDFNNILTAIIGHCDLMMMRHSPGDSDYDDIQQIRANSNRAASLTRQLLAFSRQQTLRPQVLQLPDVIAEVTNLLTRLLGETVKLDVKHGRALGPVRADPGQLEQVVVNLVVNARDAMLAKDPRGGGTVTIQTSSMPASEVRRMQSDILPVADYVVLAIQDSGTGIPPEILPKIFEPFFTTKEVGKGTGLGLSTVYGIVKQSGGYIFADSKPGQGATFTIYLPVHTAIETRAKAKASARTRQGTLWGTGTVLLVEDEDMVRTVAERALSRQGYKVLTADNGEAALELLANGAAPDLLISDVVMPAMDGPTMVRHARERHPDLPILFMSGYAEEQLRRSIDLDNVAFLPKPFSVHQLAEAAREALAGK